MMFQVAAGALTELPLQLIQQGGFLAVLVLVLVFYRRDYKRLVDEKDLVINKLTDIIKEVTENQVRNHELAERVSVVLEQMNNRRRAYDDNGPHTERLNKQAAP